MVEKWRKPSGGRLVGGNRNTNLTAQRIQILTLLAHADKPLNRADIQTATGLTKQQQYTCFYRLIELGWVNRKYESESRRARAYYTLTDKGRTVYTDRIATGATRE